MSRIDKTVIQFGKNVQKERQLQNLSQEKLAEIASLHRICIGMIERAERSISLQNAKKIADALKVSIDHLLSEE